jgi:hypothetical protein
MKPIRDLLVHNIEAEIRGYLSGRVDPRWDFAVYGPLCEQRIQLAKLALEAWDASHPRANTRQR